MKKLVFLLLLLPFTSFAKFYKCNLTMTDGTAISGFIDYPIYADDNKIKFRREEKGKNEKFTTDQIQSFILINDRNESVPYITIQLARPKLFNLKEIKISDEKSWVRVVKEGRISIYLGDFTANNGRGIQINSSTCFIKRENESYALMLQDLGGGGLTFHMNAFSNLKRMIKLYFEETCPTFSESLDKEALKKNGLSHLVKLYEQNCPK